MSFGTFNLFNFFQQPNVKTGELPQITDENKAIIAGDNGASGTVADFNWFFPYAKTSILYGLINSPKSFFVFPLYADSNELAENRHGVWYSKIGVSSSGSFGGKKEVAEVFSSFFGSISPERTENLTSNCISSGEFFSNNSGLVDLNNFFTGQIISGHANELGYSATFSGDIWSAGDYVLAQILVSGRIIPSTGNSCQQANLFSGNFTPTYKDSTSIYYAITGYNIGRELGGVSYTGESSMANIHFSVYDVVISSE